MSKVSVQQLLRPTDTCAFMIHGKLLSAKSHEERVLAIVRHEGTKEHALFVFEVDNLGSLSVDMLIPIYSMFTVTLQSSTPGGCHVEVNIRGETIVFLLPYDTSTALFFSQVNVAKESYVPFETKSTSSFQWLHGYESCRTGWDRFCRPPDSTHLSAAGRDSESDNIQSGFPDNWPWGYIITPHPDGQTEVASEKQVCESLVNEFDPLHNRPLDRKNLPPLTSCAVTVETSSPLSSPRRLPPTNPFLMDTFTDRFSKPVRPCVSETNITKLQLEHTATPTSHHVHSQENLLSALSEDRPSSAAPPPKPASPRFPRERPQGRHFDTTPSVEIENPFSDNFVDTKHETGGSKFWLNGSDSEQEMVRVSTERTDDNETSLKRVVSADNIDSRDDSGTSLDYNFRRMRTLTSLSSTGQLLVQSADHSGSGSTGSSPSHPLPTPASVPTELHHKAKQNVLKETSVHSKSPKLFRKKARGNTASAGDVKSSSWVTRYQPGVLLLKGSMRECLIQRMLQEREKDFCEKKELRLLCGTWNVNGQQAMQRVDKWLLWDEHLPDIFAIGFQELDLSPEALLRNESNREEMWIDLVEMALKRAGKYKQICVVRLVGILLLVYVTEELVPHISEVESDFVPCGIMGHLGNKGGVAIRFNVYHSSVCIVNSHLAAHMDEVEKRNQSYHQIYERLQFFKNSLLPYSIDDHNAVIWMGDLNYRIQTSPDMTTEIIKALADHYQFSKLLRSDQLVQQQKRGEAFTKFTEPNIDFKPTYKYDPSTNSWDSSEKNRAPAWCDRILYYTEDDTLRNISYSSHPEMIISDHKPVSAVFELKVKVVVPEKERDVLEQITWKLDKQENETLPQVELNATEFEFKNVKFMVEMTRYLKLRNVGQRPVQLSFLKTPGKDSICEPWMNIKPEKALILPEEEVTVALTVFIDTDMVADFNKGTRSVEDILVLHLDGGKDFFISIVGNFLKSCFGSKLETLVHLHTYMREVPTGVLLDFTLSSSWDEYDEQAQSVRNSPPPLDIPKELYRLVQYISDHGLDNSNLFTDGGLMSECEKIRDSLDTGGVDLSGSVYSVSATLLTFLRSLEEPVVPVHLHQRCMDACNNPTLCKQILMQMSTVNRRVFVFLVTFLKKLLDHTEENKMDAKLIASIFGEILLNMPRQVRLSHTKKTVLQYSKKKATFLYQFLANELTVDYR